MTRWLCLCMATIALIGCSDSRKAHDDLESEFKKEYKFDSSGVKTTWRKPTLWNSGEFVLTNNTDCEWKEVYVILNPARQGVVDEVVFDILQENGFRAPKEAGKVYGNVKPGTKLTFSFDEFVHTKTSEKFNFDRYELREIYVKAVVLYKGQEFSRDCLQVPVSSN